MENKTTDHYFPEYFQIKTVGSNYSDQKYIDDKTNRLQLWKVLKDFHFLSEGL